MTEASLLGSFAAVGLGGTLGALLRGLVFHGVARWQQPSTAHAAHDLGWAGATLFVNGLGSLVLGVCLGLASAIDLGRSGELFWMTGVCGSMTTFSTVCADAIRLGAALSRRTQLFYLGAHLILGPACFLVGRSLARAVVE